MAKIPHSNAVPLNVFSNECLSIILWSEDVTIMQAHQRQLQKTLRTNGHSVGPCISKSITLTPRPYRRGHRVQKEKVRDGPRYWSHIYCSDKYKKKTWLMIAHILRSMHSLTNRRTRIHTGIIFASLVRDSSTITRMNSTRQLPHTLTYETSFFPFTFILQMQSVNL